MGWVVRSSLVLVARWRWPIAARPALTVPAIRNAMRDVSFGPPLDSTAAPTVDAVDLAARERRLIP